MTIHIFFFNDSSTPEIYTLSLHDALPISRNPKSSKNFASSPKPQPTTSAFLPFPCKSAFCAQRVKNLLGSKSAHGDRKSTRLNSSHSQISYAVFCLKKKKKQKSPHYIH